MDERRFVVSDVLWTRLEAHLVDKASDCGVTARNTRLFLEAVFWCVRTGSAWRDLPPAFGNWNSQSRHFRRWAKTDVFDRLFKALSDGPDLRMPSLMGPSSRFTRKLRAQKGGSGSGHWALTRGAKDQDCGAG